MVKYLACIFLQKFGITPINGIFSYFYGIKAQYSSKVYECYRKMCQCRKNGVMRPVTFKVAFVALKTREHDLESKSFYVQASTTNG